MEKIIRSSFVFYESFYDSIAQLDKQIQADVILALVRYGLKGEIEPNLKPIANALFLSFKPQIDANNKKFINGKNGGAPKGNNNASKTTKNNQKQPKNNQKQPNEKCIMNNVNENDNVNDIKNSIGENKFSQVGENSEKDFFEILEEENSEEIISAKQQNLPKEKKVPQKKEKVSQFIPPTPQEIQSYCDERKNGITGIEFYNFYQSKGWMIGKNKMKDWKSAVITWEISRKTKINTQLQNGNLQRAERR